MKVLSFICLLLPAASWGWMTSQPLVLQTRTIQSPSAAHKDTVDEITHELGELGEEIQTQIHHNEKGMEGYHHEEESTLVHELRLQLAASQHELELAKEKTMALQNKLQDTLAREDDLRVCYKVTESELLHEQRNRKKELNSMKFLIGSTGRLVRQKFHNAYKAVTNKRFRQLARHLRHKD